MIVVSMMYPNTPGSYLDGEHHKSKHMPLIIERWSKMGLQTIQAVHVLAT
jgi:hypothetical protein